VSGKTKVIDSLISAIHGLSRGCGALAALCLGAACIVVCEMVVERYLLGTSTIWQSEFVTFSIVAATLLGSPYVLLTNGHVNVDLLPHYLPPEGRRWLALFASGLGWLACATLTWTGWVYFHEAWSAGWVTPSLWAPPLWIPLLALPIGLGLLTLQYSADIYCLATRRQMPFGMNGNGKSSA
jgi:TRAP-type C4-dicarboxylate transport system permease small subunit